MNDPKASFISHFSGSSVIVWKQPERIISAGERLIRKDRRMRLVKEPTGIGLHIAKVSSEDRGNDNDALHHYTET